MTTLTGHEAIEYARKYGVTLSKYADPTEGHLEGISVEDAEDVAAEDPSLLYVEAAVMTEELTQSQLDDMAQYMDDRIREKVASTHGQATPKEWLREYAWLAEDTVFEIAKLAGGSELLTIVRAALTLTTAEQIAERYDTDGQVWEDADGVHLDDACHVQVTEEGGRRDEHNADYRYTFADGSVLTLCGAGWDFGYPGCWCWQGVGHTDECEVAS